MRKSSFTIIAVLFVISVALLCLWNTLGFSVHDPIDLTIAIVWWVLLIAIIVAICILEARRRARIRTIFVANGVLYNCETGVVRLEDETDTRAYVKKMGEMLRSLDFGSEAKMSSDQPRVRFDYIVRTTKFSEGRLWTGEVVKVGGAHETRNFASAQDLAKLIAI